MNEYYHRFNENLMTALNDNTPEERKANGLLPDFKVPAAPAAVMPEPPQEPDTNVPAGMGTLIVVVTLARQAIPVEGATVIITGENNSDIIATLVTDKSGRTEQLSLPTQSAEYSQAPDSAARPFSVYNVRVEYPGYYIESAVNVPIFDKIQSIQPIALIPLSEKDIASEELLINERQNLSN